MLHTKFRRNRPTCCGEEDCVRNFTMYGHGSLLGHMNIIILINLHFLVPKKLTYKIWLKMAQCFLRKVNFNFDL